MREFIALFQVPNSTEGEGKALDLPLGCNEWQHLIKKKKIVGGKLLFLALVDKSALLPASKLCLLHPRLRWDALPGGSWAMLSAPTRLC